MCEYVCINIIMTHHYIIIEQRSNVKLEEDELYLAPDESRGR